MSWMESRRIRRVRKPTRWELWVAQWHEWLQDALEKAVCCGVDPATVADVVDAARFSLGSKQASAAFSIRSMSAYRDESDFGDYEEDDSLSETDSESGELDDHAIDMEGRDSTIDCDEVERRQSVSSEYIPFDDEFDQRELELATEDSHEDLEPCRGSELSNPQRGGCIECAIQEDRLYHRALFNCVLVELLSTQHPCVLWTWN